LLVLDFAYGGVIKQRILNNILVTVRDAE